MRLIFSLAFAASVVVANLGPARASSERSIVALLMRSAYAWNHGDLDAFMRSYENSPRTTYVSAHSVIHGYARIRAHYAARYGRDLGALGFSGLTVQPLDAAYAVVVARWHLARKDGAPTSGIFTLVLHRGPGGWRIVTDHSP